MKPMARTDPVATVGAQYPARTVGIHLRCPCWRAWRLRRVRPNLMVHALPYGRDARVLGRAGAGAVRAKLTVLANRVLAQLARADIPLIDIWRETRPGWFPAPWYDLDGLHP